MADLEQEHAQIEHPSLPNHDRPFRRLTPGALGLCPPAATRPACCIDVVATAGETHNPDCEADR